MCRYTRTSRHLIPVSTDIGDLSCSPLLFRFLILKISPTCLLFCNTIMATESTRSYHTKMIPGIPVSEHINYAPKMKRKVGIMLRW